MRSYLIRTGLLALALALAACRPATQEQPQPAPPVTDQAAVAAAIDGLRNAFVAAENAGDAAALAGLFTADGVLMPPNAPVATGKEAIQSFFQSSFEKFTPELTVSQGEVEAAGDWAFSRGSYTLKQTPKAGGKPLEHSGKYLNIVKRQPDGSWKIARHMWNSDSPLPGTGEK